MMKILIDNGHGENTPGKQSPDGRLREYEWTRQVAQAIVRALTKEGLDAQLLVRESIDVPLSERVARVNAVCRKEGAANVLLVSLHNNAVGDGSAWFPARGFMAMVSMNASRKSQRLAKLLWQEAVAAGLKGNRYVPECMYVRQNLMICRETKCAAVLTENLFMDNEKDVEVLLSEEGKARLADVHVKAIKAYVEKSV